MKKYEVIKKVFPHISIHRPLKGFAMGPGISKLNEAIKKGIVL